MSDLYVLVEKIIITTSNLKACIAILWFVYKTLYAHFSNFYLLFVIFL